ncbi:thiamine phosphate synthase [Psychrobium sp. MM17-31]|uniref:thiamine phosphate synthase n=1 Tax=Psychrobium sp. MM17-31 TaxID=2917758 RepID=UPI001EF74EBE|nr:thiamine phosphate synthase [Psychrobium sp. MM17-31]
MNNTPIVWSIGGVDPTALAGISADNRAIAATGAHGVNIVTCVTAQNSNAFFSISETKIAMLEQQWTALIEQCPPSVIKIGLLANTEQVNWLAAKLQALREVDNKLWVIYDPVLRASADAAPVYNSMLKAISTQLMPQVDLLTPNAIEAMKLYGEKPQSLDDLARYSQALSDEFACQVLLKGGHLEDVLDTNSHLMIDHYARSAALTRSEYIAEPAKQFVLSQQLTQSENRRGSGCILASLIAGFVAQQYTFCDAITFASGIMHNAYRDAQPLGYSKGGTLSLSRDISVDNLPKIVSFNEMSWQQLASYDSAFAPCPLQLGLYPVVDSIDWLERLLKQGIKTIQLRAKDLPEIQAEPLIIQAIALGQQYKARVFINDYWRLAIKHNAYGVHLGQEDMAIADLTAINRAGLRLGLSTHGLFEALWAAQFMPSYVALGHIFATQTKDMPSKPQGLDKLAAQVNIFKGAVPLTAIGGISRERVPAVAATGIGSVALVTAITKADNPELVTDELIACVGEGADHG